MDIRDRGLVLMLWLSIMGMGSWAGGTLYQMVEVVPIWSASPPESLRAFGNTDFGRRKVRFFGPATMVARNLPVILALVAAWHRPGHRAWMLLATGCFALITIFTLVHIYPINAVLFGQSGGDGSADEIRAMAAHWVFADRFRFVIGLAGLFAVLQAFRLPMQPYAE